MRKNYSKGITLSLVALSLQFCLSPMAISAPAKTPTNIAQSTPGQPGQTANTNFNTGVALTMYKVLSGPNGQEYYLNQSGQAIPLPGAGVDTSSGAIAVYTGNYGESWYVDRNGNQVDLPPLALPPANAPGYQAAPGYAPNPAYYDTSLYNGYVNNGYNGYYRGGAYDYGWQANALQGQGQPSTVNVYASPSSSSTSTPSQGSGNGSSATTTALSAGLGAAMGAVAGSAMDLAFGAIPFGCPVYYGGGMPYYYGANGNRVFVNNQNFTHNNTFNQWNDQHNWYNHQVNDPNGKYHNNNWPGKEHGFPQHQVPGRLYSPENHGFDGNGNHSGMFGGHGFGGDRFGGGHFGGGFGGFGGHMGGFGGFHGGGRR